MPRARAAARIANGAGLDALDPGQKRALGLTPDGFPLDAAGLVEVGLEQPLVSLGEAGRPVLAPAAVADIARVSPELAARLEATERDPSIYSAGAGKALASQPPKQARGPRSREHLRLRALPAGASPAPPGRTLPAPGSRWIRGRASGGSTSCGGISKSPIPRPERTRFRHHLADRNPIHPFKT